nr:MAG TPA: tail protein [Caudoviricetes sp.]
MTYNELYKALRTLAVETGSLPCLGCKHADNCGIKGCAILRAAAETIRQLRQQNTTLTAALKAAEEK